MSVTNNKGVENFDDKVFRWLAIILGVLFVVIVVVGGATIIKLKEEKAKKRIEHNNAEKVYDVTYSVLNDEVECIAKNSNASNFLEMYTNISIKVTDAVLTDKLYDEFLVDDVLKNVIREYSTGKNLSYYPNELRYLYVTFTVKNLEEKSATVGFDGFGLYNFCHNDLFAINVYDKYSFFCTDRVDEDGKKVYVRHSNAFLKPGQEREYVMLFIVPPFSVNSLHLTTTSIDSAVLSRIGIVNLGIKGGETTPELILDNEASDLELRKFKQEKLKSRVLNYNIFLEQQEPATIAEKCIFKKGTVLKDLYEKVTNEADGETKYLIRSGLNIVEAELYDDVEQLPEQLKKSAYLEAMTEEYVKQLPYGRDEYRYLVVKASFTKEKYQRVEELPQALYYEHLAEYFWLYNLDENNNLWYLGYPDDFYIMSSSTGNVTVGGGDYVQVEPGEQVSVMAAYVIAPNTLYDVYIVNTYSYLREGSSYSWFDFNEEAYNGAISLGIRYLEEGGIKK